LTFTEWAGVTLDLRALVVTAAVALAASVLFGLFPAFAATAVNVNESLKEGGERGNVRGSRHWTRRSLVAAEIALGAVLLIVTGLLIRTFVNVSSLDPGLDAAGVTTASVSLQDARYDTAAKMNRLFDESLRRIESSPGVESAAVSLELPYRRLLNMGFSFTDETSPAGPRVANVTYVTPAYFETLRIPLVVGRAIAETDTASTPLVVTVSQNFVDLLTNGRNQVGRRIRDAGVEREIVGVTGNVRITDTGNSVPGMIEGPVTSGPLIYLRLRRRHLMACSPFTTSARRCGRCEPRTAPRPRRRCVVRLRLSTRFCLSAQIRPLGVATAATARQQLAMVLVGVIGAAALLLGRRRLWLIAHSVAERRRELECVWRSARRLGEPCAPSPAGHRPATIGAGAG
jgi:hypothetical protein